MWLTVSPYSNRDEKQFQKQGSKNNFSLVQTPNWKLHSAQLHESSCILLKWTWKNPTPKHPWVKLVHLERKLSCFFYLTKWWRNRTEIIHKNWEKALVQLCTFIQCSKLLKQLCFLWETWVKNSALRKADFSIFHFWGQTWLLHRSVFWEHLVIFGQ